jgi:hypothetical protein
MTSGPPGPRDQWRDHGHDIFSGGSGSGSIKGKKDAGNYRIAMEVGAAIFTILGLRIVQELTRIRRSLTP